MVPVRKKMTLVILNLDSFAKDEEPLSQMILDFAYRETHYWLNRQACGWDIAISTHETQWAANMPHES